MKHIRKDRTFVYYYTISQITGESRGLRFSRGTVASFRGNGDVSPEALPVGHINNLPISEDDVTGEMYDTVSELIDEHPEVADLVAGRKAIEEVL